MNKVKSVERDCCFQAKDQCAQEQGAYLTVTERKEGNLGDTHRGYSPVLK